MSTQEKQITLTFPEQLDIIRNGLLFQKSLLQKVSEMYADAIMDGGVIYVYANGHSRLSVEEATIRMGALTGFYGILQIGLTSFTDVVGANGIRVNQTLEKYEGIADSVLKEFCFGPKDVMVVVTATGTTAAAVDMAIEFIMRYPNNPIVAIASKVQSAKAATKHSSGKNLIHVIEESKNGYFIDNSMPYGDLSVTIEGKLDTYQVCPLSSIGALSVVQSLNELTIRELDSRGYHHKVLRNMHINNSYTSDNYNEWIEDQHKRYSRALYNPNRIEPTKD